MTKLGLGSPWSRDAFTSEQRGEIEALIPDDCRIVVTTDGKRRYWAVRGYRDERLVSEYDHLRDPVRGARLMARVLAAETIA